MAAAWCRDEIFLVAKLCQVLSFGGIPTREGYEISGVRRPPE
jgi:hypothetical protein